MARTEIYIYTNKRKSEILVGWASNAAKGALSVWFALSKKYLGYDFDILDSSKRQKLWGLSKDKRLTRNERIVLASTCDGNACNPSGIKDLVFALREVNQSLLNANGNLSEQADIIENAVKEHKDIRCVMILATSVLDFKEIYKSEDNIFDIIEDVNRNEKTFNNEN